MAKTAIVTGANRGLGLEVCRQLGGEGFRVILTSRDEAKGQEASRALAAQKLDAVSLALDVSDARSVGSLVEALRADGEPIDVLVNNAGIALDGFDSEVARRTLAVNLYGAMQVTDAVLPLLSTNARIVMVSSGMGELSCLSTRLRRELEDRALTRERLRELTEAFVDSVAAGRHTQDGWPASGYRVSKVALNAFTRILARELSGSDVLVNAVCPGWVRTAMGGPSATRTVEEGASGIVSAAMLPADGPTGGFFRDGHPIDW